MLVCRAFLHPLMFVNVSLCPSPESGHPTPEHPPWICKTEEKGEVVVGKTGLSLNFYLAGVKLDFQSFTVGSLLDAHLKNKWTLTWIKLENSLRLSCSPLQQLLASQRGSGVANKGGPLHSNPIISLFSGASARGGVIFKNGSNFYSCLWTYLEKSLAFVLYIDENRQSVSDWHRLLAYCETSEKKKSL